MSTGREQMIVPLMTEEAVRRARPQPDALSRFKSEEGGSMAYVFAPRGTAHSTHTRSSSVTFQREFLLARFFFPQGPAVLEDPATGSATANLGGWCIALGRKLPCRFEISQGEQAARPSMLYLDVESDQRIRVSGDVVELGRGTLTI